MKTRLTSLHQRLLTPSQLPPSANESSATTAVTAKPALAAAAGAATAPKPAAPAVPKPAAKPPAKAGRRFFLLAMFGSWIAVAWTTFPRPCSA